MNAKSQIITALREEYRRWEEILRGIREEKITTSILYADMSIKDVVAHMTAWQEVSVARMEAALKRRQPEYPAWHPTDPGNDDELDGMNAWIYRIYHDQPWPEIQREWRERFLRFLELAQAVPEKDLFEAGKYPWLKEYPLAAVLEGTLDHHEEHRERLDAFLRQTGS
jgi:hypothetical protein